MTGPVRALTLAATVGAGALGGVFFAFSAFVVPALARLPDPQGAAAMQAVNATALRPPLMAALFGTAGCAGALAVHAARAGGSRQAAVLAAGSALYLAGVVGLTAVRHVPLNAALAALDPASPASGGPWRACVRTWTAWNHARAGAGLLACAAFALALRDPAA